MKSFFNYKRLLILVSITMGGIAAARFSHHATAGFRISKIQNNFFHVQEYGHPFIPQGPFTYLGRGLQSFAFVSEDGNYVLKIFNNHYQRTLFWLHYIPFSRCYQNTIQKKLDKTSLSYEIAIKKFQKQTGIVYAHMQPSSHLQKQAEIIDRLGITHTIDLDASAFVIQKKATLVYPQLLLWKKEGKLDLAQAGITSLIQLIKTRFDNNIADHDPLIRTNFGFCGTEALHIDIGAFSETPAQDPQKEFLRIITSLKIWVESYYQELLPHLEQEIYAQTF